ADLLPVMTTTHRLFQIVGVALLPVAAGVASIEASCDGSHIEIVTQASVIDRAIPVTWSIDHACNPVETGISVSGASGELVASGVPVHGGAGLYGDEITVPDTGLYWVTAYAVDEQGSVVQSPPRVVLVIIPPLAP